MPQLGYGVFQVTQEECERCVLDALKAGYRAIDTAQSYYNEEQVGAAIEKTGVDRKDIFLTTKVWIEHYGYEKAKASVLDSMEKLRTDYLDLCLLHHNFFGITAYGKKNVWWTGTSVQLSTNSLSFRTYPDPLHSFMDYARLIRHAYTPAADVSNNPQAFARSISYSRYISEVNGDNREAYRILLIKLCRQIEKIKD